MFVHRPTVNKRSGNVHYTCFVCNVHVLVVRSLQYWYSFFGTSSPMVPKCFVCGLGKSEAQTTIFYGIARFDA
jgi:hypothetical protein